MHAIYVIDGNNFSTLEEFFREVSRVLVPDAGWGFNLEAFNDILGGGFGTPDNGFTIRWINHEESRRRLGDRTVKALVEIIRGHGPGGEEAEDGVYLELGYFGPEETTCGAASTTRQGPPGGILLGTGTAASSAMRSLRPGLAMLSDAGRAGARVDGRPLNELIDAEVHLAFVGKGAFADREIVALTNGAVEALKGESGDNLRRMLQGGLALADGRAGSVRLHGMSFANFHNHDAPSAFSVNRLASHIDTGFRPAADQGWTVPPVRNGRVRPADVERTVEDMRLSSQWLNAQNPGWMDVGSWGASRWRDMARAPRTGIDGAGWRADHQDAVRLFGHELEHSVSPPTMRELYRRGELGPLHELEERTADLMAHENMRRVGVARRMGVVFEGTGHDRTQNNYGTVVLRELLNHADIDPSTPRGFAQADRVLQRDSVSGAAARLSEAVGDRRRLPVDLREWLDEVDATP